MTHDTRAETVMKPSCNDKSDLEIHKFKSLNYDDTTRRRSHRSHSTETKSAIGVKDWHGTIDNIVEEESGEDQAKMLSHPSKSFEIVT